MRKSRVLAAAATQRKRGKRREKGIVKDAKYEKRKLIKGKPREENCEGICFAMILQCLAMTGKYLGAPYVNRLLKLKSF